MQVDSTPDYEPVPGAQVTQPRAISLDRASEIAREVRELVSAGQERVAWERMRHLHPADIGTIVAGLPRASRDVMLAVIAFFWKQNIGLGLVLELAMFGNMIIAGTVGAGVPLLLRRLGVDPAVASAVVVTTFTDVFGFLLFLGIARAFIGLIL